MKSRRRALLNIGPALGALALLVGLLTLLSTSAALAGGETFTVDSNGDDPDSAPGDCICATAGGDCTLRAAIEEANACSGAQTIRFGGPWSITPATALPALTDDGTVIDGGDHWAIGSGLGLPAVVLDGAGGLFSGLEITATHCAIYGIQIIKFGYEGMYIHSGAQNNTIGGTGEHQRNVISRNEGHGVLINGTTTMSNTVVGNYIGTPPEGADSAVDWGNHQHGVSIWWGDHNVVRENLVADNGWSGVTVDRARGTVQSNRIGMDVNGQPLGNTYYGIHIDNAAGPTASFNEIAFNRRGVYVGGVSDPWIYHNTIYSNTASTLTPPDGGGIFVTDAGTHGLINYNDILSNTAHNGGGIAVEDGAGPVIYDNTIRANRAYTSGATSICGGGVYVYQATATIARNQILTNKAEDAPEPDYGFPSGGGICLQNTPSASVEENEIRGNVVSGNAGGGGGIRVTMGDDVRIRHNTFIDNDSSTWSYGGGAIDVNSHSSTSPVVIDRNWIADNNTGFGGAVYFAVSSYISVTNNVIVHNRDPGLYVHLSDTGIVATHNTIAQNLRDGITVDDGRLGLYNSIVVSNTGYGVTLETGGQLNHASNDVWANSYGSSDPPDVFDMELNPLFFDAAVDEYGLRCGSPCIDAADPLTATSSSYSGLARPQGDGYDIGAYETACVRLPLVLRGYP
jgi:CSLREA domain-containing protein